MELYLYRTGQVSSPRPYALLYLGLAAAFALWWLAVPKWPRPFVLDVNSLVQNGLMFAQAAAWPLTIAWRWAPPEMAADPQPAAVAVAVALGLGLLWLGVRARMAPGLALGLGWLVVTALPVWATLPYEYLEDGSRLYYLPGIGIALGWAALTQYVAPVGWQRRLGQAGVVVLCAWAVWQSLDFLAVRRAMYVEGTAMLRQAASLAAAAPRDTRLVFLNLAAWKAPAAPAFPLGNTGVTFVPEYVLLVQALHVNGAAATAAESLANGGLPGGWPSHYGPHGRWASAGDIEAASRSAYAVYVARYSPGRIALERLSTPPAFVAERPSRGGSPHVD
jgi:hypothetical protein